MTGTSPDNGKLRLPAKLLLLVCLPSLVFSQRTSSSLIDSITSSARTHASSTSAVVLPSSTSSSSAAVGPASSASPLAPGTAITSTVVGSGLNEPSGDKVILSAWVQTESTHADRPSLINSRIGTSPNPLPPLAMHHITQQIPILPYNFTTGAGGTANETMVEVTGTDAMVFLTVYPDFGLDQVKDSDLTDLGNQLAGWQKLGRKVFLRWAPEMNGPWNPYWGLQPTLYVQTWKRMYSTIKSIAPNTAIVWAPNILYGYPYGATLPPNAADAALLDTDGDRQLTGNDDPYSPYFPGNDWIDWAAVSIYFKAVGFKNDNQVQPSGYCSTLLKGLDPYYGQTSTRTYDFYKTYCQDKPCAFSESGAAFHESLPVGSGQSALQMGWVNDCVANQTFLDQHPRLKLINMFEYEKIENDSGSSDLRDYRLTNSSDVMAAFKTTMSPMLNRFVWANVTNSASNNNSASVTPSSSSSSISSSSKSVAPTGLTGGSVSAQVEDKLVRTWLFLWAVSVVSFCVLV